MAFSLLFAVVFFFGNANAGVVWLSDGDKQAAVDVHNQYRIQAAATAMQKFVSIKFWGYLFQFLLCKGALRLARLASLAYAH